MTKIDDRVNETRFAILEQEVAGIKNDLGELRTELRAWMQSRTRSPWQMVALLLAILVPLGWIFNIYITSAISPVAAISNQGLTTANSNATAITRMMEVQTSILRDMAGQNAERQANEREVETQIDAMNQSLSVQFANQQRMNADFQNAMHDLDAKYPAAPDGPYYFPNISNRNHKKP